MSNFKIEFSHPWFLLLLIPALILTLYPYFRLQKKYRRNRNRVISVILHGMIMLLSVLLVSGFTFHYDVPNKENEILLLVDASYSNREEKERREDFITSVINDCGDNYRIGIVKFGFDQKFVAPFSNDAHEVYRQYLSSEDPDIEGTDIAAALKYAGGLFQNPKAAKIVLISDGIETDGDAAAVIRSVAATGVKVDAVCLDNQEFPEVQLIDVIRPDYNLTVGVEFTLELILQNNMGEKEEIVSVTVMDGETESEPQSFALFGGVQTIELSHTFSEPGLHELRFVIKNEEDRILDNNSYYTYIDMKVFDKILLIEKDEGESEMLLSALSENYDVRDFSIEKDLADLPTDVEGLCEYDQVLLVNIANDDLPAGFDELLYTFVNDLGGGMFTLGGNNDTAPDGTIIPHAYNRDDMFGTLLQQMLPVHVINYTPPVAVMLVIDCSGSMGSGERNNLFLAKQGALSCLDALGSQDFCGVIAFDSSSSESLQLTPMTQKELIREKILSLPEKGEGSTIFSDAIRRAGAALNAVDVDKKHIILVTDGQPGDAPEDYNEFILANRENDITMSIVTAGVYGQYVQMMDEAAELGGGKHYSAEYSGEGNRLAELIYKDLVDYAISEIEYGREFAVRIGEHTPTVAGVSEEELKKIPLKGYYGVRKKEGAVVPYMGEYSPIYAQWDLGKGRVGSFMSAFNRDWAGNFLETDTGKLFLSNIVNGLFPTEEVEVKDISVRFNEDNFTTDLNVYTEREEGEVVEVKVTPLTRSAAEYYGNDPIEITAFDGNTRFSFVIKKAGLYRVDVTKLSADGTVKSGITVYKTFSYSEEYNAFPEEETTGGVLLEKLASVNGKMISDSLEIFADFNKTLHRDRDPRLVFLIIVIVAFLLDIAVRKFKFKWIHEIIRDGREKKLSKAGEGSKEAK